MSFDLTNRTISAFTLYKFIKAISKPFVSMKAYKMGLIDGDGYFTKPIEQLTARERSSVNTFDLFVIYVKRLFSQIPNPSTRAKLASTTAALNLFREELETVGGDWDYFVEGFLDFMQSSDIIDESMKEEIANVASSGQVAGMGYNLHMGSNAPHPAPPDDLAINQRKALKSLKGKKKKEKFLPFSMFRRDTKK